MKKYCTIILILLTITSCQNAYDIEADDEIIGEFIFNNVNDLERGAIGIYSGLSGSNVISYSSRFSDDLRRTATSLTQGLAVHSWQITASTGDAAGLWNNFYSVINRTNRVLEASKSITINNVEEEQKKTKIIAEATAIRAYAHFELMRLFSQSYEGDALSIPYVNKVVVFEQLPRNTVSEVVAFIEADLEFAYSNLEATNTDNSRITKNAVTALRARLALYAKKYDEAIAFSTEIIDNVNLANTSDFRKIWTDESEEEVLFKLKRVTGNSTIGSIFQAKDGSLIFGMSFDLMNHFFANGAVNDVRIFATVDVPNFSINNPTVGKYLGTTLNPLLNDIKLLRVGEQYLIRAEAKVRKTSTDLAGAASDIQILKNARLLNGVTTINYGNISQALDAILSERRMELAYEGHRLFDLRRFNKSIVRSSADCAFVTNACTLDANDYKFVLPIPQAELFANENMVQNNQY